MRELNNGLFIPGLDIFFPDIGTISRWPLGLLKSQDDEFNNNLTI